MENSTELNSTCQEHISDAVNQCDEYTSRKTKSFAEELPDGKRRRLSQASSSPEPEPLDSVSDSEGSSSSEDGSFSSEARRSSLQDTSSSPRTSGKRKSLFDGPSSRTSEEEPETSNGDPFIGKYKKEGLLGVGGYGSIYAGYRISDELPVAIKYIPAEKVFREPADYGKQLPTEVAVMLKAADGRDGSVGTAASVSLVDFYDMENHLILVMERPTPAECLFDYKIHKGRLDEEETKIILKQLILAIKELEEKGIFHQDIKLENILIETGSEVLCVRLIDFGLSSFTERDTVHKLIWEKLDQDPPDFDCGSYLAGPTTVWQLAVVMFEVLHEGLFQTNTFLEKELKISQELSGDCKDFMERCLAALPENRPTLEELLLHPWLTGCQDTGPKEDS